MRARGLVLVCALVLASVAAPAAASSRDDPAVVAEWNAIAVTTLVGDPTRSQPEGLLYMGFVHAAVYNAVVGITGGYEPYRFRARAPHRASAPAAAVAAAHRVLVTYSPAASSTLDAAYAASLSRIPDGPAKAAGVAFGELAADTLIRQRADDGRNAPVSYTRPPAPGVWRPTPPALAPFAVPWLGAVRPLLVRDGAQFGTPGPPPALGSARYAREFAEVKALGSATSTVRTPAQTDTARFFAGNVVVQFNAALRDQVALRGLSLAAAARMFAAVDMSLADTAISVWHSKYRYAYWRPVTAIALADTDGNPATTPDPTWTPMIATPPYPDWVSGYSAASGAFTAALAEVLDTRWLRLTLTSTAVPGVTRSYVSGRALDQDVVDARVWLGIHFRSADTAGVRMGHEVAGWAADRYFRPLR
ncbi:vanadium-dependent haloperoxidase [Asanoa sp. WMMD1127]|uniref:vanadium-dependent haloperoxidase n=1 Tax=Asanoa sp. WMMD1127 TaxID=3016107 RepID=UPI002416B9EA|nr:vanadium-dependent haloperoxidase [Asanoa sp. WMMD1127]MDG4827669.1 vanadium-dependent haloperoxidase [Asanoa sp. WMMD1127]